LEQAQIKCDLLVAQYAQGPLPFAVVDDGVVVDAWNITETGNDIDDSTRGFAYAELLARRAKAWRNHGGLSIEPARIIFEVLIAIAAKGKPGPTERAFLWRFSELGLIAALN